MRVLGRRNKHRITMEDVVFVLGYIRDRNPRTIEEIGRFRIAAFHDRLLLRKNVHDYQTIEANCVRDRGLTADEFDRLVFEWLIRGHSSSLQRACKRSFGRDDITANAGWAELFSTAPGHSKPPIKNKPDRVRQLNHRNTKRKPSLNEVLDAAEELDAESQSELVAILKRRIGERGRRRVVEDVEQARREYAAGQYQLMTAAEIIREASS